MQTKCPICNKVRKIGKRQLLTIVNCRSCATKEDKGGGHRDGLKKCTICKHWKPLTDFTSNTTNWDNLEAFCRQCNTVKMRSYRERNREKINQIVYKSMKKYPQRTNARALANWTYPNSEICSVLDCNGTGERHHPNYSKPKEIIWFCRKHHRSLI